MPEKGSEDKTLREQLDLLHKELETAKRHAPEDSDILGHVMTDVARLVSGEKLHPEDSETLKEQLETHAADFETRHPRIAGILREVMDILSRLGI